MSHRPDGILLLAQPQLAPIPEDEMLAALPEDQRALKRLVLYIDAPQLRLDELGEVDWHEARQRQALLFEERVKPTLLQHPGYRVAYFGLAPVPLAMHLGYLIGAFPRLDIYQRHHIHKDWRWHGRAAGGVAPRIHPLVLPRDENRARAPVVVRVATSYQVHASDTAMAVPDSALDIDIALEQIDPDALALPEDLDHVADAFRQALDALVNRLPSLDAIHVFAAVPAGLAFRLGACINPTLMRPIEVYQHFRSGTPRYRPAFTLQAGSRRRAPLSIEEKERAAVLRHQWAEEARRLILRGKVLQESYGKGSKTWLEQVLPDAKVAACMVGDWQQLPCLFETPLVSATVAEQGEMPLEVFHYDETERCWRLSDRMLLAISRELPDEAQFRQAGRLFLMHEGVHIKAHGLTSYTASYIGRFPKLLEEVDYQADVWALLHEYAYERTTQGIADERRFFLDLLETVLSCTWAFGDDTVPVQALPVRRLNRYLLWFWQRMLIGQRNDVPEILRELARRPLIELAGLPPKVIDGEFCYLLNEREGDHLEVGVLHCNRIERRGEIKAVPLSAVLTGFRLRDRGQVQRALLGAFDSIVGR